jgi:DNA-binding transcriptional LysR family regulator
MDYRYLKAFMLTARHLSFSKAAEILNIAQSAVSRQVKLLEESIGVELIIRSSKKVILTNKGKEFYASLEQFDRMTHDIFEKEDNRPIKVGILNGLLKDWFGPLLSKYFKKYDRDMKITVAAPDELHKGIEQGKYDIIFSTENFQSDLVSSLKLFNENLVLISKEPVNRKKLHDYRWIVFSEEDNLFKISKKKSDRIIIVESMSTIVSLVKNSIGIAVVPDHVLKKTDNLHIEEVTNIKSPEIYMTSLNFKNRPTFLKEILTIIEK